MGKYILFSSCILFLILSSFVTQQKTAGTVIIKGHITETFSYCGGARPDDELLAQLNTPKPMKNKIIYVKAGTENKSSKPILKRLTTDDNGEFSLELKIGKTYCFLEDWKGKPLKYPKDTTDMIWDHTCIAQRYKKADFVLTVKADNNPTVTINFHHNCSFRPDCGTFSGPVPP